MRRHGHALSMIARRGADHAAFQLLGRQVRHLVVGAAQLEAEDSLLVLTLEQYLVVQPSAQVPGGLQRRLDRHVVDACREDLLEVIGGLEMLFHNQRIISRPSWARKKPPDLAARGLNPPREVEETTLQVAARAGNWLIARK